MSDIQIGQPPSPSKRKGGSTTHIEKLATAALENRGEWVSLPKGSTTHANVRGLIAIKIVNQLKIAIHSRGDMIYVYVPVDL